MQGIWEYIGGRKRLELWETLNLRISLPDFIKVLSCLIDIPLCKLYVTKFFQRLPKSVVFLVRLR